MRTVSEIEQRAKKQFKQDGTGWEWTMYVGYLPYSVALHVVKMGGTDLPEDQWRKEWNMAHSRSLLEHMRRYLPYARKIVSDDSVDVERRKLKGVRSLKHYIAWFWLAGQDEMANTLERYLVSGQYRDFGLDMLEFIDRAIKEEKK